MPSDEKPFDDTSDTGQILKPDESIASVENNSLIQRKLEQLQLQLQAYESRLRLMAEAETVLREREHRLRSIFHQTSQLIALLEPNGTVVEINQSALDFAGVTAGAVVGRSFWDTQWWAIAPKIQAQLREAIARAAVGEKICYETSVLGVGNRVITIDFSLKPIWNNDKQVIFLLAEGHNVTQRKQTQAEIDQLNVELEQRVAQRTAQLAASNQEKEEALQRERQAREQAEAARAEIQLYADIFESMQVGLNVWHMVDPTDATSFELVAANPVARRLAAQPDENCLGQRILDCFPNAPQEDLDSLVRVVHSGQDEGRRETYHRDERVPDRCYSYKVFPLSDRKVGVAFEEITERKRAERALSESERRYAALAKISPVGIFRTDSKGNCLYVNDRWCEITGLSLKEALGASWFQTIHPDDRQQVVAEWQQAVQESAPFQSEYRFQQPDGNILWVVGQAIVETGNHGEVISYVGSITDITERKQVELVLQERAQELIYLNTVLARTGALAEKRNQELDQFAYVASHDLKAPLRAIANLSEWIEEDLQEQFQLPEESKHQMQLLRGRVQRMESLINGLLEYSRIGRIQIPTETVVVADLLAEVIDSLAPPASFTIEVAANMPTLTTKQLLLEQVFSNLIGNAIKYHNRTDGKVTISLRDQGKFYEFAVKDDGPGIAPAYHEKIFAIFQTLEARDTRESTGIGLSIVKKIIETEGGTIRVESQVDAGTTFYFTWAKRSPEDKSTS